MIALKCGRAVELACALVAFACFCEASFATTKSNAKPSLQSKETRKSTKSSTNVADPREAQARQSAERARLALRIATLKKEIAAGEKSRAGTATALARAERALSEVDKRIEQLAEQQYGMRQRIADLDRQRSTKDSEIVKWQGELARTAIALSANRDQDPWKLYLTGRDPNSVMLNDAYLEFIARAQIDRVGALRGHVSELQREKQRADAENRLLAQQADAQKSARESLVVDQSTQRKTLAKLSQTLTEQRKSAGALEADEQRLARVVDQLQREIDRRAALLRARQEAAKRRADELANAQAAAAAQRQYSSRGSMSRKPAQAPGSRRMDAPPDAPPDAAPDTAPDTASGAAEFAQQRGHLRLPVRGSLVARFGARRGEDGASWKGLFIKTDADAEVRSVATGRVVFSDYLRGFGNLLIVDHGNQYLSIYGNNASLLKHAGDAVKAGDVLSLSGNSSGDDQTGLYFELRFRGKPFDPMGWVGPR